MPLSHKVRRAAIDRVLPPALESPRQVAEDLGVHVSTVYRWLREAAKRVPIALSRAGARSQSTGEQADDAGDTESRAFAMPPRHGRDASPAFTTLDGDCNGPPAFESADERGIIEAHTPRQSNNNGSRSDDRRAASPQAIARAFATMRDLLLPMMTTNDNVDQPEDKPEQTPVPQGLPAKARHQRRRKATSKPDRERATGEWTIAEKWRILVQATSLNDAELGALLRYEGLHKATLVQWQTAVELALRDAQPRTPTTTGTKGKAAEARRIKELEREVARKDKALADIAAFQVLRKKYPSLWGDEA